MSAELETELKLSADEGALRDLAAVDRLGPATLGPPRTVDEVDVYLDTAAGALALARWACRLRSRDGRRLISCKGPAEQAPGDMLHRRPEVAGPAPEGDEVSEATSWPPSPARDLVLTLTGTDRLGERLTLRQRRTERRVEVARTTLATLSLDRVAAERDGVGLGDFAVVELELAAGVDPADLDRVLAALRAWPGLDPDPLSKLEHALALAGEGTGASR